MNMLARHPDASIVCDGNQSVQGYYPVKGQAPECPGQGLEDARGEGEYQFSRWA